ncbi:MAG: carboxypeptidase-like regulatory domain-containing protein, partial [Vicinamibacterales bacterium]|nr:carboxypeptidase-like regulatory domain-containing protein [Vicinamibacterales bacterium]
MTTTARIWIRSIAAAVGRRTWRQIRTLSAAGVVLLVGSGLATAQTGAGSLQGRVTDVQDGPLVGVTVTVQSSGLRAPLVLVTDATGAFAASRLTPGEYAVALELVGFQTVRETVSLRNGDTTTL